MKYLFFTAIYLHYQYGWGLLYAKEDDGKTYTGFFQDNQKHQIDSENHTEGTDFFNSFVKDPYRYSTFNELIENDVRANKLFETAPAKLLKDNPSY